MTACVLKARAAALGKKNLDIIRELERRGIPCATTTFSRAIWGKLNTPKGERIRQAADQILTEWENGKEKQK